MKAILTSAMAVLLLAGSAAMADADRGRRDQRYHNNQDHRGRGEWHERRDHGRRDWDRRQERHDRDWRHRDHDDRHWRHDRRGEGRRWHHDRDDGRYWNRSRGWQPRRDAWPDRYRAGPYHRPFGYRDHAWHRGARLPAAYCAPHYVVRNYETYHLRHPPRGYRWVRVDDDVVLAALAGGLIVEVVNGLFY